MVSTRHISLSFNLIGYIYANLDNTHPIIATIVKVDIYTKCNISKDINAFNEFISSIHMSKIKPKKQLNDAMVNDFVVT